MIKKRKMNTIVNITGLTLRCLKANDGNVIKKQKTKEYNKLYYLKNKEIILKKNKLYWDKNIEKINKYQKDRYEKNKKEINKKKYLFKKERLKQDVVFKLTQILRRRILLALKGNNKSKSTINLLGADVKKVWEHLESTFKPGMTKENHGKWHIDHIRPCSSFDLSKPEEQAKCFHYTNLQALWAHENLSKGSKFVTFMQHK